MKSPVQLRSRAKQIVDNYICHEGEGLMGGTDHCMRMEKASDNCEFKAPPWGAWLAQSEEHVTLDFRVVNSSLTLGVQIT